MTSCEIRKGFLDFFAGHGHPVVKSSPLIPEGDPTLLFTSAGMVQFKPYYLGLKTGMKRAASCQKSFRTTDIDNVGRTIRHLTFFEMLGNFSFGDYFKAESIKWGWDFLTKEMGLKPGKFYPSVYGGGVAPRDEEARKIWESVLPASLRPHIVELGDGDNFWAMGDTGPSGPCSEIYWDRGEKYAHPGCLGAGCSCDRYIEVWNHVFTQFDKQPGGVFNPLPKKNIDTGMGLERLTFIVEGKETPFDTTLFYPIVEAASKMLKVEYDSSPEAVSAFRIISEHLRASVFLLAEGVIPSNEGRGYVLRRLIRRAARYGRIMGAKDPFLHKLVPSVHGIFSGVYPEIIPAEKQIKDALKFEEQGFIETLETGERFLAGLVEKYPRGIPGAEAFRLYETYGFPLELTRELALKKNIPLDEEGFNRARRSAQETAKANWKDSGEQNAFVFQKAEEKFPPTVFAGYEAAQAQARIVGLLDKAGEIAAALNPGTEGWAALDCTPFYAESGGQVGDLGLFLSGGAVAAEVMDTRKPAEKVFFHHVKAVGKLKIGDEVKAVVSGLRYRTACNHTAVHVINATLKEVFGPATRQAGSIVTPEKFRFDYTTVRAPSREELAKIEALADAAVRENYRVFKMERPLKDAEKFGAVMLLGEKYKDPARFVLINRGGWDDALNRCSLELCGGTHIDALSELMLVKILKDSSVSRGVRRIEGVAGPAALDYLKSISEIAEKVSRRLSVSPEELAGRVEQLLDNIKELKVRREQAPQAKDLSRNAEVVDLPNGARLVTAGFSGFDTAALRGLSDSLRKSYPDAVLFLYSENKGKLSYIAAVSPEFKSGDFSAADVVKKISGMLNGSGGGRRDFAQGGGPAPADLGRFKTGIIEIIKSSIG
ncbi:MAG: alanine--tRNA ligase [Elusimicrobia bacterium]|nr:alanine--tRNA ligase [Elusimicrobiota bacterium]